MVTETSSNVWTIYRPSGDDDDVVVTKSGSVLTFTPKNGAAAKTVTVHGSTQLIVSAGVELEESVGGELSGLTITGDGEVEIVLTASNAATYDATGFDDGLDAVEAVVQGEVDISSNDDLGRIDEFELDNGAELTLTAAQATGKTIEESSEPTPAEASVTITGAVATTQYNFSNITATNGVSVTYATGGTLHASTDLGGAEVVVASGQTLALTALQASGKEISGAGAVTITGLAADTNLSNITASGTITGTVTQSVNFSTSGFDFSKLDALTIDDGETTTITVTVSPEQYVALQGKYTTGTNDTLVSSAVALVYSATTFTEAAADDGSISNTITITLVGDTFTGNDNDDWSSLVTNEPTGLTASLIRTTATTATLTLSGNATAHANSNDVPNLTVTFTDTHFTTSDAAAVTNATKSDLVIDFIENLEITSSTGDASAINAAFAAYTGTTATVNASSMNESQIAAIAASGNLAKIADGGITNLTITGALFAQWAESSAALAKIAAGNVTFTTDALTDAGEIAAIVSNIDKIAATGIKGEINLTAAQFATENVVGKLDDGKAIVDADGANSTQLGLLVSETSKIKGTGGMTKSKRTATLFDSVLALR